MEQDAANSGILSELRRRFNNTQFGHGFLQGLEITSEDRRDALWAIREARAKAEAPRPVKIFAEHPLVDTLRQIKTTEDPQGWVRYLPINAFDDDAFRFRANSGLNVGPRLDENHKLPMQGSSASKALSDYKQELRSLPAATKAGYALGGITNDFTNNASRSLWWLLNAPQAVVDVFTEGATSAANPRFYASEEIDLDTAVRDGLVHYNPPALADDDKRVASEVERIRSERRALGELNDLLAGQADGFGGYTTEAEEAQRKLDIKLAKKHLFEAGKGRASNYTRANPGVKIVGGKVMRRAFNPNHVQLAAMLPAAVAINTGIGLMGGESTGVIGGRQQGYAAAVPDEDDARRSANAIAEVASRYILGREGRLLEAEDFLLERPDVTYGEYQAYRNYLRDRDIDLNPFDDGKINLGGVLKTNPDGIRGAEISFLGKSLPGNDTAVPTISAIAGTVAGALGSRRMKNKANALGTLALGGTTGLVGGMAAGNALEEERRKRNFQDRNPGIDYDTYKANARQLLDDKYELMKANPNAEQERQKSRTGFNKRNQQQALNTKALQQQTLIDQILDEERRAQAQQAMGTVNWALGKSSAIDQEIASRKAKAQEEEQPMSIPF